MFDFKPFSVSSASSAKEKLIAVLDYLEVLIKDIVGEGESGNYQAHPTEGKGGFWSEVIDDEVLARLHSAWPDIKIRIEKGRSRVREMNEEMVYDHGLSGPELDLKLETLMWASRELVSAIRTKTPSTGPKKSKRLVSLLKKNFGLVEVPIGSILEATGASTALKELVQILTHIFKDFNKR